MPRRTAALTLLTSAGVEFRVHEYRHDPAAASCGEEAVERLGLEAARVFKTLVAEVPGPRRPELVVGIVPVSGRLSLKALATALGAKKAELADPQAAERSTGYLVGGISPLAQRHRLRTVLDSSALQHATIYVSAGRRGHQVELAPTDLVRLTSAQAAPISSPRYPARGE